MSEYAIKTFEQEAWSARARHWIEDAARATSLAAAPLLEALEVGDGDALLDLCCGPGVIAGAAYARGAAPVGVDFAPAMVAKARERLPDIAFQIGDAAALDVREGEYDAIACNFALQHVAEPEQAMREALRALKPGGRFAWTHWLSPEESPVARACADALARHGDPSLHDQEQAARAWRLAKPTEAVSTMRRIGFRSIDTKLLALEVETPRERAAATAWAMIPRAPLTLDRQSDETRAAIDADLVRVLSPKESGERMAALRAPALLCVGVKPHAAVARPSRFGIVKKLLQSAPKTDGV